VRTALWQAEDGSIPTQADIRIRAQAMGLPCGMGFVSGIAAFQKDLLPGEIACFMD
jgi:hypothetical protein